MAKGYQKGNTDVFVAFKPFQNRTAISQAYVDGLSIIINSNTPKHVYGALLWDSVMMWFSARAL